MANQAPFTRNGWLNSVGNLGVKMYGSYVKKNDLPLYTRACITEFDGLVLVRESIVGNRTIGTLWHKNQVLAFTVEDIPRAKKIDEKTSIPASDDMSWKDSYEKGGQVFVDPDAYWLHLTRTGKDFIRESFVNLNVPYWDKKKQEWTRKDETVGPLLTTSRFRKSSSTAKENNNAGLVIDKDILGSKSETSSKGFGKFDGIRIHQGTSEKSSHGCIIISGHRNSNGTLKTDIPICKALTKYIYRKRLYNKQAIVIQDAYKEIPPFKGEVKGRINSSLTGDSLKYAKVYYPKTVAKYK